MLTQLPSDCLNATLSFLPLQDVVRLTCVSIGFLHDTQLELKRRRRNFIRHFCYNGANDTASSKVVYPLDAVRMRHAAADDDDDDDDCFLRLPTIQDRIESLVRAIPSSHPCVCDIIKLRDAIRLIQHDAIDVVGQSFNQKQLPSSMFVVSLLEQHVQTMACHKLHASILHFVLTNAPPHFDTGVIVSTAAAASGSNGGGAGDDGVLRVPLERYIGDVLCTYYLMGNSVSGIVEASFCESDWISSVLKDLDMKEALVDDIILPSVETAIPPRQVSASTWYRAWVFVHSSLLRVAPFSLRQQTWLGIASTSTSTTSTATTSAVASSVAANMTPASNVGHDHHDLTRTSSLLLRPHGPFMGTSKLSIMRALIRVPNFSSLRATVNNFGPLGPSFRGRDLIESISYHPASIMGMVVGFEHLLPEHIGNNNNNNNDGIYNDDDGINYHNNDYYTTLTRTRTFVRAWEREEDSVIQCMLLLHEQSRKSRPMTVLPPLISLRGSSRY